MSNPNGISGAGHRIEAERARFTVPVRAPLALALLGAAVIGILALFYVHEVTGLTAANDELHALQAEQTQLERQDAHLHAQLGEVTSPAYVDQRARALGLMPNGAATPVIVIVVPDPNVGGQR